jgi:deazaflavin-dependent oxidoreductase (nitroreductase family)
MSEAARGTVAVPEWWADEQYCYLTTRGRVTGRLHEIEIWFGVHEGRVYMISGGGERADWVKNLQAGPGVKSRVGEDEREARAHVVKDGGKHPAGRVLAAKYQGWREGWPLSDWAASALLVERPP